MWSALRWQVMLTFPLSCCAVPGTNIGVCWSQHDLGLISSGPCRSTNDRRALRPTGTLLRACYEMLSADAGFAVARGGKLRFHWAA